MSAKGEETVVAANLFDAEQLAPQRGEQGLQLAFGWGVGLDGERVGIRRR